MARARDRSRGAHRRGLPRTWSSVPPWPAPRSCSRRRSPRRRALESEGAGFSSLAGRSVAAVLPDPSTVAASSAALLALQTAVGGDARTFTALSLGLDTGVVPTRRRCARARQPPRRRRRSRVTTEQAVLSTATTRRPPRAGLPRRCEARGARPSRHARRRVGRHARGRGGALRGSHGRKRPTRRIRTA